MACSVVENTVSYNTTQCLVTKISYVIKLVMYVQKIEKWGQLQSSASSQSVAATELDV